MAYSRPSPAKLGSPLSIKERNPRQADPWRERPEVRTPPWLKSGKWPKTAQNGSEWPPWSTLFLSGQRPIFGLPGRLPTHLPDTKWPQMAPNGTEIKKIALSEDFKVGGNPFAGPRFKPPKRWLVFPLQGNPEGAAPRTKATCSWQDPSFPRRRDTRTGEMGASILYDS